MALTLPANETSDGIKVTCDEMGTKLGNYVALIDSSGNEIIPSTSALQTAGNALLTLIAGEDFATEDTLADILAKIIAAPATEAKQDTGNTALANILAKLSGDPATQTTLAAILAKIIAAPATEAKQDTANTSLANLDIALTALRDAIRGTSSKTMTDIVTALGTVVLAAGTSIIGKVGIDQTTPGTTNAVYQSGSVFTLKSAPVVGTKTVSTTAAEIFAGSSRLSGRYAMTVYNESSNAVYWGPSGITTSTGFPILPGDSVTFQFSPSVATAIYMIASASAAVRAVELA